MHLFLTMHAKEQMVLRGVSKSQVLEALQKGAKIRQTDGFLSSYGYVKVAYKIRGEAYIIKTVMVG
ncbi:DUF4258 domain-containing protein [Candidatus Woesearchaeota archaeon]|nr:DUF4258 domain-containing protein [Candidatus Woesearchaeota archaeon]